jgi:hypothetical protein
MRPNRLLPLLPLLPLLLLVLVPVVVALPAAAGPGRPPAPVVVPIPVPIPVDSERIERRGAPRVHEGVEYGCALDVDDAFADLDAALYALADEIDDGRGRDRRRLRDELAAVVAAAEVARERACRAAARRSPPPPPPPPPAVLGSGTESALKDALRAESFDDGRLRLLETALRADVCVTPAQARGLVEQFSFGRGRLAALERLAARIVDDGSTFTVLGVFAYDSEKRDAQRILQATSTQPSCRLR